MAGAGILGNLRYNHITESWLVELGQFTGVYELAQTRDPSSTVAKTKSEARTAINKTLAEHGLPHSLPADLTITSQETSGQVSRILKSIKMLGNPGHVALFLIAESACVLRWEPVLSSGEPPNVSEQLLQFARERLEAISREAPDVDIATDALWDILRSYSPQDLTTPKLTLLLMELSKPLVILVVSADAKDSSRLRVGEERRELYQALRQTRFRDMFEIRDMPSCRVRDITSALDEHNPDILLFTGHGSSKGLCFEDDSGRVSVVRKASLAAVLGHQKNLKLVILNACYSQDQAQCIADSIGHVVGMEGAILDTDAVQFSREFFTALGHGRTFEASFQRARDAIGLNASSQLRPHFLKAQPSGVRTPSLSATPLASPSATPRQESDSDGSARYLAAGLIGLSLLFATMFWF